MPSSSRPPRVLVATTLLESLWPHMAIWEHGLRSQKTELLWDVAVVDGTDTPSPGYTDRLYEWAKSRPFGPTHRVRLLRVGLDVDGSMFAHPHYKFAHARQLLWSKFTCWSSYEYLLTAALDVGLPSNTLQLLHSAAVPWAVAITADAALHPLRLSLLHGELVRTMPFHAAQENDLDYCRACAAQGVYPALVLVT